MTNADAFDRAIAHRGGRLPRERWAGTSAAKFYGSIARHAEELIASAKAFNPGMPDIHFDFIYNGAVNAVACKSEGRYFIGITSGALMMLQLIFFRMLADPRILRDIGNPNGERSDLLPFSRLTADAESMVEVGIVPERPAGDARWWYANYLMIEAALFLVGHEITHISHGHLDYWLATSGNSLIQEIGWNEQDQDTNIERQALEADADQRSFIARIESARLSTSSGGGDPPWVGSRPNLEQRLFDLTFAVNALFRMFGDERIVGLNLSLVQYPPFPLRRVMLTMTGLIGIDGVGTRPLEGVSRTVFRDATTEVEKAFAIITGDEISVRGLEEVFSAGGLAHIAKIEDYWRQVLHAKVLPFRFG